MILSPRLLTLGALQDEFEMNLRLIGAPKLSDIGPEMVDAKSVGLHVNFPGESSYMRNCKCRFRAVSL